MIDLDIDMDLEALFAFYKKADAFMPVIVRDYDNRMAFNTMDIAKRNVRKTTIRRAGSARFITSGRVIGVNKARFSRDIERIESIVGGRVVPTARDPNFMERLEKGGRVPKDKFGNIGIPTVKGARGGNMGKLVSSSLSVPKVAAKSASSRNVKGSHRKKRAVAIAIAVRERKTFARFKDRRGRDSLYRVKGKGRGKKRRAGSVGKIWTLSRENVSTRARHWLTDARDTAIAGRTKTFKRVAEFHYKRIKRR